MFFSQDWRERIKTENPDAGFGEVGKLLGAKWKELDDEEKKVCAYTLTFGYLANTCSSLTSRWRQRTRSEPRRRRLPTRYASSDMCCAVHVLTSQSAEQNHRQG